jgi:hypothetical protein
VLDTRVFSLGVLTDQDGVDVVVGCLVASDGSAWSDVGEEVEGSTEGQVEGDVALANGGRERALKGDQILLYALDGLVGNDRLAVFVEAGGDIDRLPLDGDLGRGVDILDGLRDLRADTVTLNEGDAVLAVAALGAVEFGDLAGVAAD